MIRVSFPLPLPLVPFCLYFGVSFIHAVKILGYTYQIYPFSPFEKKIKGNKIIPSPSPIPLHRSFSFPPPKLKKKKEHNPPRYCTSEPRRVSMLCLPIAASKDKLDCNKNLLTLYTLLYIDCTRISNITHSKYSTSVHVLYIHQTLTIARHWTYTKTNTTTRHCVKIAEDG